MQTKDVSYNLICGSRPKGFQDLQTLNNRGILSIISLETGFGAFWDKLSGHGFDEKSTWIHSFHGGFISMPLSNFLPPSTAETRDILNALAAARMTGPVFIHCYAGVDRTGFIVAAFRALYEHWSPEKAWQEALDKGLHNRYKWWRGGFMEAMKNLGD